MLIGLLATLILIILASMAWSVVHAKPIKYPLTKPHFFLSTHLFSSLIFLINFWLILLILIISNSYAEPQKQNVIIMVCIFALFLCWWRHKRRGENS